MLGSWLTNNGRKLEEVVLQFVRSFPYFTETDSDVEPVENSKRHRDVGYDSPGPNTVVVEQSRVRVCSARLEC